MQNFARLLIATLAWGVLAFASVYPWAYWPLAALCTGLGVWALMYSRQSPDPRARGLTIALALLVAAIATQMIAFPYSWLGSISPGVDRFLREFELVYHPASLHPLSLAPDHTVVVLCLATSFAVLLSGLVRVVRKMPLDWFAGQLMGLGVAFALIGIIQKSFFQPDTSALVYGFWVPEQGGNPFGPFINRNHFAGWMVMAAPVVLGYSVAVASTSLRTGQSFLRWIVTQDAGRFLLIASAGLIMAASIALTNSRSGIASFGIALTVLGYFLIRSVQATRTRAAVAGYLAAILVGGVLWAGPETLIDRFGRASADTEVGRIAAWRDTLTIARDFPVFGVGLGSYGRAMLLYQTSGRQEIYAQAHNDYLQLLAEGGALVVAPAIGVLVVFVVGVGRRLRLREDDPLTFWLRRGAIAGLVGIAAQSVVEFSLQMPGNAVMFVVLAAFAFHRPRRLSPHAHRV